ncbi:SMI1/KNR4 family protein [Eikenella sp. S3360]|uniref:SMI1/KNR4 family protein n=1 Tax=Eikenella glucosivorans TaxID=2766967 RepID=A0ABS0N910_9NEIS|nr:SMI1/KNR4 family protein [Eikenella glucosivorans]MBH5328783.1 SMI1/KNR4 family protein [Eikenella glucosivorans]
MQTLLRRILTQLKALQQQYPAAVDELGLNYTLNPGATDADFAQLEQTLGFPLPEDFKALYRAANGENGIAGILIDEEWLSIERITQEYKVWKTLFDDGSFQHGNGTDFGCTPEHPGIKPDFWWNPKWIPLTADGGGNGNMIDLDPAPSGTAGQIIRMWHDSPERSLEAPPCMPC